MKTRLIASIIFLAITSSGDAQNKTHSLQKAEWLVGSWQGTYNGQPFYEAWRKLNDATMLNFTIEIKGKDTVINENAIIRVSKNDSFYRTKEASWNLVELGDSVMVLGNDSLKFANRIRWSRSPGDHWIAIIENPKSTISYDLVRIPWMDRLIDKYLETH